MSTEPESPGSRSRRPAVIVTVVAVVAFLAVATTFIVMMARSEEPAAGPPPASPTSSSPTSSPSSTEPSPSSPASPSPVAPEFAYQPLWPFTDLGQVEEWQADHRADGQGRWHLDAPATAIAFTTEFLDFPEIDRVVWSSVESREALVAVGYPVEGQDAGTAAVVHLARFGAGADAPWEVVGTRDSTLTLTQPDYGATVSSPFTAGGQVTGVDENIRVQVRQPNVPSPIGEAAGVPVGGESVPWSNRVAFRGATAPALTVVASTGGHVVDVERFAITAVRAG